MKILPFRIAASSLAISMLIAGSAARADGVGAGTLIENTASASYDGGSGTVTIPSNTVTVRVDELLDVALASLNSGPVAAEPGSAVLSFELTNTGNGPEAFTLATNASVAGNDFDTTVDAIAVDSNQNGTYDPGVDQILTGPETTAVLIADDRLTIFVVVTVPAGVTDGQSSELQLIAQAVTGTGAPGTVYAGQGVDGGDAIVGATNANASANGRLVVGITSVDLIKSATVSDPFGGSSVVPGAVVTYTITANVSGSGQVSNLIVSDSFPNGTTYEAGTLELDAVGLTDAADADAGEANATGIAVDLGTVAGGTSHSITFDVSID